jgi:hypothetical protein
VFTQTPDSCARIALAVSPADSDLSAPVRALYVGTGGNLRVTTTAGNDVTFANVATGSLLPVSVRRVWTTGTTATNIVGLV